MSRSSDRRAKPRSLTTSKIVSQTTKALPPRDHVKTVAGQDSSDGGAKALAVPLRRRTRRGTFSMCLQSIQATIADRDYLQLSINRRANCALKAMLSAAACSLPSGRGRADLPTPATRRPPPAELHISFVRQGLQLPLFGPLGSVRGVTLSELQENARKTSQSFLHVAKQSRLHFHSRLIG